MSGGEPVKQLAKALLNCQKRWRHKIEMWKEGCRSFFKTVRNLNTFRPWKQATPERGGSLCLSSDIQQIVGPLNYYILNVLTGTIFNVKDALLYFSNFALSSMLMLKNSCVTGREMLPLLLSCSERKCFYGKPCLLVCWSAVGGPAIVVASEGSWALWSAFFLSTSLGAC